MVLLRINLSSRTRATKVRGLGICIIYYNSVGTSCSPPHCLPWPQAPEMGREYSLRKMPISSMFYFYYETSILTYWPQRKKQNKTNMSKLTTTFGFWTQRMTCQSSAYPLNVPPWTSQAKTAGNGYLELLNWCRPVGPTGSAVQFLSEQQVQKEKNRHLK